MSFNARMRGKSFPKAWVSPVPERVCPEVLKATSKSYVLKAQKRWPVFKNPTRLSRGSLRISPKNRWQSANRGLFQACVTQHLDVENTGARYAESLRHIPSSLRYDQRARRHYARYCSRLVDSMHVVRGAQRLAP